MSRAAAHGLIFDWSRERHYPFLPVLAMIMVSLALHAASFYLVQIIYPDSVSLRPPPAVVNLQPASLAASQLEVNWLAGEDPSLLASWSLSQLPPPSAIISKTQSALLGVPSDILILPAPPRSAPTQLPDAILDGGTVAFVPGERNSTADAFPSLRPVLEVWAYPDNAVGGVRVRPEVSTGFIESALPLPLPTAHVFVDNDGLIRHVFLIESTGNHDLDSAYAGLISGLRLPGATAGWLQLAFTWRVVEDTMPESSDYP